MLIDTERKPWLHLTLQGSYFIPITMKVLGGLFFNSRAVTCDKVLFGLLQGFRSSMALCGTIMLSSEIVAMFRQQVNSCSVTLRKKLMGVNDPHY